MKKIPPKWAQNIVVVFFWLKTSLPIDWHSAHFSHHWSHNMMLFAKACKRQKHASLRCVHLCLCLRVSFKLKHALFHFHFYQIKAEPKLYICFHLHFLKIKEIRWQATLSNKGQHVRGLKSKAKRCDALKCVQHMLAFKLSLSL